MSNSIVVVGAGQAGVQAVDSLRREGYRGPLVLIGAEAAAPYQRPPLSKKYLAGELPAERLALRQPSFYSDQQIELILGNAALHLDRRAQRLILADGRELGYGQLLLCLGASARRLDCPGAQLAGVHYLRGIADADALGAALQARPRVVIVGGGYIGLETAASCRTLGCEVTVLEMGERLMGRVVAPVVSHFFAAEHTRQGIRIVCGKRIVRLTGTTAVTGVECADGSHYPADLVIVGVGGQAVTGLAAAAGLACDDGILVDADCRTSDPLIFAAGDCCNFPGPAGQRRRLESVDNAFEQAKVAAQNLLGGDTRYARTPWFWSDQFDLKLLIVGLAAGHDTVVVRGSPADRSFSVCYLRDGVLIALEAVNQAKDYMAARKLIDAGTRLDPQRLADPGVALGSAAAPA